MHVISIEETTTGKISASGHSATLSFDHGPRYEITVKDPLSQQEEDELAWYFEEYLRFPFLKQVRAQRAAASIPNYGEALFKQVFQDPDAYTQYRTIRDSGLSELQIEITGSPGFHALHWEVFKDPKLEQPLALQAILLRKNLHPQAVPIAARSSSTINVLIVTARLSFRRDIGYRTISRPLVEALRQAGLPVQIDIVRPGTFKALADHLRKHREGYYHVVHLDMHGAVMTYEEVKTYQHSPESSPYQFQRLARQEQEIRPYEGAKAFLAFEPDARDEEKKPVDLVEAAELAKLLVTHRVPIAMVNACQSGKQVGDQETSLGSRLIREGVQLVLAMGYSVTVSGAELLMTTLYKQLFAGEDVRVAIRHARIELYNDKQRRAYFDQRIDLEDWLLPVVYQNYPVQLQPRAFTPQERQDWLAREVEATKYAPPDPTYGFVGRDLDILQIERRLLFQGNILLVRGMGGAGKTTLLKHLGAWWHITGFVQRVFYFGYDTQAWTREQILTAMALDLYGPRYYSDVQPLPLEQRQAMLARKLRSEHHLLILDNLESITGAHLAIQHTLPEEERAALHAFLTGLAQGNTLVLLGSRSREDWLAAGTFDENSYDLGGLDDEAATTLAERILKRHQATKYQQDEDLRRLIALLDGFPLALEVVLANLKRQTPGEVLEALQAGDITLDPEHKQEGKDDFEQKTRSILRCIDYSHSNLSLEAQQLLLCLAPFTSVIYLPGLTNYTEHLKQQTALERLPFDRWIEVLREAQDWGLLTPHAVPDFLQLQPIFPYFLRTRLNEPGQAAMHHAIETAFREYYIQLGSELSEMLQSKDPKERQVGKFLTGLEYENLVTALNLALVAYASTSGLHGALMNYLDAIPDPRRGAALYTEVLERFESYPADKLIGPLGFELVNVLGTLANWQLDLKHYTDADTVYHKLLERAQQLAQIDAGYAKRLEAITYHQLGRVAQEQRQFKQAEQYYQQALQLKIEFNDRYAQASTYHNLGAVAQEQREFKQAEQYYQQALQLYQEFNDRYEQAIEHFTLANMFQAQQHWIQARAQYQQALPLFAAGQERVLQAQTLLGLGRACFEAGDREQAVQYVQQAVELFQALHEESGMHRAQLSLDLMRRRLTHPETGSERTFSEDLELLEAFLSITSSTEMRQLIQRQPYLLTDEWSASVEALLPTLTDEQLKQALMERLEILKHIAQDSKQGASAVPTEITLLDEFMRADWTRRRQLLMEHADILLSEDIEVTFAALLNENTDPAAVKIIDNLRTLLRRCRSWGVDPAWYLAASMRLGDDIAIPPQHEAAVSQIAALLARSREDVTAQVQAIEAIQTLLESLPADAPGLFRAALLYDLARTLEALPTDHPARQLDRIEGSYREALARYESADRPRTVAYLHMRLGDLALAQRAWASAITEYEQALPLFLEQEDQAGQAYILVDLGWARFELGNHEQGIQDMQQATALFRELGDQEWMRRAEQRLAQMRNRLGHPGQEISEETPIDPVLLSAFLAVTSPQEILHLVQQHPQFLTDAWLQTIEALIEAQPGEEGKQFVRERFEILSQIREATERQSSMVRLVIEFASADWVQRRQLLTEHADVFLGEQIEPVFDELLATYTGPDAVHELERVCRLLRRCRAWGLDPAWYFALGMRLGDDIEIPPEHEAAVGQIATVLSRQQEDAAASEQAIALMRALLNQLPAIPPSLFRSALRRDLAETMQRLPERHPLRDLHEIEEGYRDALVSYQSDNRPVSVAFAQRGLGEVLSEQGRYAEALELLQAAAQGLQSYEPYQKEAAWTFSSYASALDNLGRSEEAVAAYAEALALLPAASAPLFRNRAEALIHARRLEEAEADLARAVELDGNEDSPYLWYRRAQIANAWGDGQQAEQLLDEVLKRDATFDVVLQRAQSAWLRGDLARSQQMLQQALREANAGNRSSMRREMERLFEEHPELPGKEALQEMFKQDEN